jgi:phage terminase large subunit-like protein
VSETWPIYIHGDKLGTMAIKKKVNTVAMSFIDFCRKILGLKLTLGQRVIAKVCYDYIEPKDLKGQEREYATKIFGDVETVTEHARRIVTIVAGRGSGKSSVLSSCRLLHLALTLPLDRLASGEKGYALIICPDLKTAKQTLEFVKGQAESSPFIRQLIGVRANRSSAGKQVDGIRQDGFILHRPDGRKVSIECLAASKGGRSVRGRSLVCVVLDECAFFEDENHAVNDKEIFAALLPRMMKGSQLIIASTPWADMGLLYDLYKANFGQPHNSIVAVAPTLLMMPTDEMKEAVKAMQLTEPERAQQEFFAKFMQGGVGSWFDPTSVEKCIDLDRKSDLEPNNHVINCAGCDLAFTKDNAALVIVQYKQGLFQFAFGKEHSPSADKPLLPSEIFSDFTDHMKRYHCDYGIADRFNEAPFREHLEKNGLSLINIPAGNDGKTEMYTRAKTLFREGRIAIPDNPRLIKQLKAVKAIPMSGGKLRIDHERRKGEGHGDLVSAFVAALWQCYKLAAGQDPEYVPGTYEWHAAQAARKMDSLERRMMYEADMEMEDNEWDAAGLGIRLNQYDSIDWERMRKG